MAGALPTASATKETTNYARLCRLLVDIATQVLRDKFDAIHSPANLHAVLARNVTTLKALRAKRIINPIQWGVLFPPITMSVSSRDFDTTLLVILLRNLCGLIPPVTGWDALPAVTDLSCEADIARVKYFRNTVYGHAVSASVDDTTFNDYWQDIQDTLVRLGGVTYKAAIDTLRNECMDPEVQAHYTTLLNEWKKDDNNVIDLLNKMMKKIDALTASKEVTQFDQGGHPEPKEMMPRLHICKENYHENEMLEYYCQQCNVCICHKCGQTGHECHEKVDIRQAAEERKVSMENVLDECKAEVLVVESKINEQVKLRNKSKQRIVATQNKVTETVEMVIQDLRNHEAAIKAELTDISDAQEKEYQAKLEEFQRFATELKRSIDCGEDIFQRGVSLEILQKENVVFGGLKELLNQSQVIQLYKPEDHVNYVVNRGIVNASGHMPSLGQIIASKTDHSQSVAEGKGLNEAECGAEAHFNITTRDSKGNKFYHEDDQVTVTISSPSGEEEVDVRNCNDSDYTASYKPRRVGQHDIEVKVNGMPLTESPWIVNVTPHPYEMMRSKGSQIHKEFICPWSIAENKRTGDIAVAGYQNKCIQLFDKDFRHQRTLCSVAGSNSSGVMIGHPMFVAFLKNDGIIFSHEESPHSEKMSVITNQGQFIECFSKHLTTPHGVFVKGDGDGDVIVCDVGDQKVKVLSPDGVELLQYLRAPNRTQSPEFACYHHDMFFVSYLWAHCVKVFSKEGVFLHDIGSEGSPEVQLTHPMGLAVDGFDNLIVCDTGSHSLKMFSLDGTFLTLMEEGISKPWFVIVNKCGHLLVTDLLTHCVHFLQ